MKVRGPGSTQSTSGSKKADKASEADSSFRDMVTGGAQDSTPAAASQSIAQVDALLAVQATEDPTAGASKKKMRQRAHGILDGLEDIRMAMLRGDLTVGHMIDIADVVASHREKISDPTLTALMDEVDLRAQVELAKMRQSMENT